jgi:protease-4
MDADEIWAHPSTITGSIGIFGLIPTIETPLAKLGIHTDGVGTTPLAGALRIDRPLSPAVQTIIQSQIDRGYRNFIEGVANGRGMTADAVDEIARGRVWSGAKAKEIGLIDEFGGLEEAAAAAARRAQLGDGEWSLEPIAAEYHFPFQMFSPFFSQMGSGFSMLPKGVLARVQDWLQRSTVARQLSALNDPQGIYAYCFCEPVLSSPR